MLRLTFKWKEGEVREVRVLSKAVTHHAFVSSPQQAAEAIKDVPYGDGVYITINPVSTAESKVTGATPRLTGAGKGTCTADLDIHQRTLFVLDLDPVRATSTSASRAQLDDALALAQVIIKTLRACGWPDPTEILSGNGAHLYWDIDLPGGSDLPARALKGLAARFGTATVKVDTTVGNAARIMRVPGTWTAKGSDRSLHRVASITLARIDSFITAEQLEAVTVAAAPQATQPSSIAESNSACDIDRWLTVNGVPHKGKEPWPGGGAGASRWVLTVCPFNPGHNRGEAVITQQPSGAVGFTCHHDSCSEHSWKEFRRLIENAAQAKVMSALSLQRTPYPIDSLPPLIRDVAAHQAEVANVDAASIAVPLLASILGVIGNSVVFEPWPSWTEASAAWAALIAPSGSMKSSTIGAVENALSEIERDFPPAQEDSPRERLVTTDSTVEALADIASKNPRGLILLRDELAGFVRGIGQYKNAVGADEPFWLSAYDGRRHIVDRRSTGTTVVNRLLVSIIGGIQPAVFKEVMQNRTYCESGFAARWWLVWPTRRRVVIERPSEAAADRLSISKFRLQLCLQSLRTVPMADGMPMSLKFEDSAADALVAFANRQEEIGFALPDASVERSCRSKARGWAARLAGMIALVRSYERVGVLQGGGPTTPDWQSVTVQSLDIEAAILLTEWQLNENARVLRFLGLDDPNFVLERYEELAQEALDPVTRIVTSRAYQRKHQLTAAEAEKVLDALVDADLWDSRYTAPGSSGGRPTIEYFPRLR